MESDLNTRTVLQNVMVRCESVSVEGHAESDMGDIVTTHQYPATPTFPYRDVDMSTPTSANQRVRIENDASTNPPWMLGRPYNRHSGVFATQQSEGAPRGNNGHVSPQSGRSYKCGPGAVNRTPVNHTHPPQGRGYAAEQTQQPVLAGAYYPHIHLMNIGGHAFDSRWV